MRPCHSPEPMEEFPNANQEECLLQKEGESHQHISHIRFSGRPLKSSLVQPGSLNNWEIVGLATCVFRLVPNRFCDPKGLDTGKAKVCVFQGTPHKGGGSCCHPHGIPPHSDIPTSSRGLEPRELSLWPPSPTVRLNRRTELKVS